MDPATQQRKRRGRRLVWLLAGLLVVLPFGGMLYATFGPNPPIVVSKATTHLTSPLDADGLPDYAAALLADMKKGVTPENNGAVPLLKALWGVMQDSWAEVNPDNTAKMFKELGATEPENPLFNEAYWSDGMHLRALQLYRERVEPPTLAGSADVERHEYEGELLGIEHNDVAFWQANEKDASQDRRVTELLDLAATRPWSEKDLPFAADWVAKQRNGFENILRGAMCSHWYFPVDPEADEVSGTLFGLGMGSISLFRSGARYLQIKALHDLGMGAHSEAASHALAIARLGQHASRQPFIISRYVGNALAGISYQAVNRLAAETTTPTKVIRDLLEQLSSIGPQPRVVKSIEPSERYFALHYALGSSKNGVAVIDEWPMTTDSLGPLMTSTRLDWNQVLTAINQHYDGLVAALSQKKPLLRRQAARLFDNNLQARANLLDDLWQTPNRFLTPTRRADLIADAFLAGEVISCEGLIEIECHNQTEHDLTIIHLALAIHRIEQGVYPDSLESLVPSILSKLPVDLFNGKPYAYRRTADGFLLYSLGNDGVDDGGSCELETYGGRKFEGISIDRMIDESSDTLTPQEQAAYDLLEKIPAGADDVSLRIPLPIEPWPWEE